MTMMLDGRTSEMSNEPVPLVRGPPQRSNSLMRKSSMKREPRPDMSREAPDHRMTNGKNPGGMDEDDDRCFANPPPQRLAPTRSRSMMGPPPRSASYLQAKRPPPPPPPVFHDHDDVDGSEDEDDDGLGSDDEQHDLEFSESSSSEEEDEEMFAPISAPAPAAAPSPRRLAPVRSRSLMAPSRTPSYLQRRPLAATPETREVNHHEEEEDEEEEDEDSSSTEEDLVLHSDGDDDDDDDDDDVNMVSPRRSGRRKVAIEDEDFARVSPRRLGPPGRSKSMMGLPPRSPSALMRPKLRAVVHENFSDVSESEGEDEHHNQRHERNGRSLAGAAAGGERHALPRKRIQGIGDEEDEEPPTNRRRAPGRSFSSMDAPRSFASGGPSGRPGPPRRAPSRTMSGRPTPLGRGAPSRTHSGDGMAELASLRMTPERTHSGDGMAELAKWRAKQRAEGQQPSSARVTPGRAVSMTPGRTHSGDGIAELARWRAKQMQQQQLQSSSER